jgi:hypothetical protein
MKRHKNIFLAIILAAILLAGSISGVVLASDEGEEENTAPEFGTFLDRVLEIYQDKTNTVIDKDALRESFEQAREELQIEQPRFRFPRRFFDCEELTEEQRADIEAWLDEMPEFPTEEFKEWLESKPDIFTDEFKEWLESRPEEMPLGPSIHSRFVPRIFGHMDRIGDRFHMFDWVEPDQND